MTRAELIRAIGKLLFRLDSVAKDKSTDEETLTAIVELRKVLAKQQVLLAIGELPENATSFNDVVENIDGISAEFLCAMDRAEAWPIAAKILRRLVAAVDSVVHRGVQS